MVSDYRPEVLGEPDRKTDTDPKAAIETMERELKDMAESLRLIRIDYVNGVLSQAEFETVESRFGEKLAAQRQILQNLRAAALVQREND